MAHQPPARRSTTGPLPAWVGWHRPRLPGRELPAPEGRLRRALVRGVALAALGVSGVYLVWRIGWTLELAVWWLSIPLVALEVHAALGLGLFAFSLWDVDRRPAVERLASELGARYLTRPDNRHAKAGNLNHALEVVEADFIAVLDADHVAAPDFLVHTLGYFDDPRVALVQTPQDFYNETSFEHETQRREPDRFHEQVLFYRVIQPGKNRWGAAFWCGTGAVVRVAALRDVGGVATDTITEDIHTTIRFHRRGWRTVYHNEVLARGLAASDAATYQLQRHRWGTGAMQVLRVENPLVVSGLTLGQRLAYAATLLGWFDAWRSLGYLLLPIVVVATGAVPIRADAATFGVAFGSTFVLQQLALRVLSRGCHRPVLSTVFELVRMTPNLLATTTLLTNRRATFRVTPKGRTADGRRPPRAPLLLRTVLVLSVAAAAWYGLTLAGLTPVRYAVPWAVHAAFGWLVVNALLVGLAVRRVRSLRFAGERRAAVRFEVDLPGRFADGPCRVLDLSLIGARIATLGEPPGDGIHELLVVVDERPLALQAVIRTSQLAGDGRTVCGLEFSPGQTSERAALALELFRTRALPV
ncbi:MAG TPA: glycosyltransferase, partial [Candidatus Limnocylindrales bacterium]|nr:glycosyltransferase [Candidatus Limnocylindrales bacterium]